MEAAATTPLETSARKGPSPLRAVLSDRNFRLLWIGEGISLLGDQFYLIALPWLVLQLTGDAFAMGMVLALEGIPRALFILLGGAITDRFSPRTTMLVSNLFRLGMVGLLTGLVLTGLVHLWMIYVFALIFGLADAIFFPAQSAIVPQIVRKSDLQTANAIVQGTAQLSLFAGPVLAGALIALFGSQATTGSEPTAAGLTGIGIAFGFDTLTFAFSVLTLWLMRTRSREAPTQPTGNVLSSIREGLANAWQDATMRIFFILVAAINLLVVGPISVGIPVLADLRFAEGAAAYGIILSAYGGGALVGTIFAGLLPRPPARRMGTVLLLVISTLGIGLVLMAYVQSLAAAALITLVMGIANGYTVIQFVTWLQGRTPEAMLGRTMSLLMFASVGLIPVSNALAGALIEVNLTAFFVISGALMAAMTLLAALNPATRSMESAA
ncbi:MAG: MFS transporter [Anaerolineae bacterium]|nr:MFS transporter [Anaerolineae bacterium]